MAGSRKRLPVLYPGLLWYTPTCRTCSPVLSVLLLIEELELLEKQILVLEEQMAEAMRQTDYAEYLLSIKGIGVVALAMCLGELGDPTRFEDARQMSRMADYNLIEDSSGAASKDVAFYGNYCSGIEDPVQCT